MDVRVSERDGVVSVALTGGIHIEQADELLDVFNSIIEKNPKEVVIDLSDLKSITSSGIGKIVLLYKGILKCKGKVKITGVNDTIMQIFKIVKLDKLMEIKGA
jgi:anti-sigma B factor antagonist